MVYLCRFLAYHKLILLILQTIVLIYKKSLGVRWRCAVGAKIEGILGVNRVVTEEKSQKEKKALELGRVFEADPIGVPTSPEIPPIPPLSL